MRRALTILAVTLVACTRPLASIDDEAGVTTNVGEESTDEESTDEGSITTTDSASTDGPVFVQPGDVQSGPASCDPFAQDCPAGEKCVPYGSDGVTWDGHKCVPVLGDQPPGEPCKWNGIIEATDDCDANSACWDVMEIDGELIGQCKQFCKGTIDDPECPEGGYCLIRNFTPALCIYSCDPLLQDCGAGLGCFWANVSFACVFTAGEIPTGDPCGYINDCAPGNFCTNAASLPACAGEACCTNFCDLDLGDMQCSEPGTACAAFFENREAPPVYEDVGICIVP